MWGDIDKEGYEIFGYLKKVFPHLKSVLMKQEVIENNKHLHQRKEIYIGPFRAVEGLQLEYEFVSRHGIQIEQEQIRASWPFGTELK